MTCTHNNIDASFLTSPQGRKSVLEVQFRCRSCAEVFEVVDNGAKAGPQAAALGLRTKGQDKFRIVLSLRLTDA